jgi:acetyltransferase-like isoleucine patch superfamily enzyme
VPYAFWLTKKATGSIYPLRFVYKGRFIPVNIRKDKTGNILIGDKVIIESWGQGNTSISITVGKNAELRIEKELIIGQDVILHSGPGALLNIKGRLNSTGSGITCSTRILAEKSIEIGYDSIIGWGCSITDSNWHDLSGTRRCSPVVIGNQVWVGHDVSILPGAIIGDGCAIGAKSLVLGGEYESLNLLAGNPVRIIRENINWSR